MKIKVQDGGDQRWGTKLGDQERVRAYQDLRQQGNVSGVQRNVAVQIGDWSRVEMVATAPDLLAISHLTFLTV
ncbi:hypothetical protein Bca52824_072435 [Brassica carinata]|uniref:Uncharacterized protein n=1 Tax=Brassica carinata TaxID=52824 RepID=A0A8X7U6X8_BRACI|nr:hypothetical protein Bca52824_072435 [Brassica carinata]